MQLPEGWEELEADDDGWRATVVRRGECYEVDGGRHGERWWAVVTRVRGSQRHRVGGLDRPTLDDAIAATERLLSEV